jgi:hypothetical protein
MVTIDIVDYYLGAIFSSLNLSVSMCLPSLSPPSQNLASFLSSATPTANPSYSVMFSRLSLASPNPASCPNSALSPSLFAQHGFSETTTPILFRHHTHSTAFTLVVDDFLVRYSHPSELDHLVACLSTSMNLKFIETYPTTTT